MKTLFAILALTVSAFSQTPPGYPGDSGANPPTGVYACGMEHHPGGGYVLWVNDARFWDILYCPPVADLRCWNPATGVTTVTTIAGTARNVGEHTTPGGNKADWSLYIAEGDVPYTPGSIYYFIYPVVVTSFFFGIEVHEIATHLF